MVQINDQMRAFCRAYVLGGPETTDNAAASAVAAGYAPLHAKQTGYRLLHHDGVRAEIMVLQHEALAELACRAIYVIRQILETTDDSPQHVRLRLDAAKTVLDRAGHVAPKAAEPDKGPNDKPMSEWSLGELEAFVEEGRAQLRAMKVIDGEATASSPELLAIDVATAAERQPAAGGF